MERLYRRKHTNIRITFSYALVPTGRKVSQMTSLNSFSVSSVAQFDTLVSNVTFALGVYSRTGRTKSANALNCARRLSNEDLHSGYGIALPKYFGMLYQLS